MNKRLLSIIFIFNILLGLNQGNLAAMDGYRPEESEKNIVRLTDLPSEILAEIILFSLNGWVQESHKKRRQRNAVVPHEQLPTFDALMNHCRSLSFVNSRFGNIMRDIKRIFLFGDRPWATMRKMFRNLSVPREALVALWKALDQEPLSEGTSFNTLAFAHMLSSNLEQESTEGRLFSEVTNSIDETKIIDLFCKSVKMGNIPLSRHLCNFIINPKKTVLIKIFKAAAKSNQSCIFNRLFGPEGRFSEQIKKIISETRTGIMRDQSFDAKNLVITAARRGNLTAIKFIFKFFGYADVQYFNHHFITSQPFIEACIGGHLDIVYFLAERFGRGYKARVLPKALQAAVENCNPKIIEYIAIHFPEQVASLIPQERAQERTQKCQWSVPSDDGGARVFNIDPGYANTSEPCILNKQLATAAAKGSLATVMAVQRYLKGMVSDASEALAAAIEGTTFHEGEHLEVFNFLITDFQQELLNVNISKALLAAVAKGNIVTIQTLTRLLRKASNPLTDTESALLLAIERKRLDIVELLTADLDHYIPLARKVLEAAIASGDLAIVEKIATNLKSSFLGIPNSFELAMELGRADIIRCLISHFEDKVKKLRLSTQAREFLASLGIDLPEPEISEEEVETEEEEDVLTLVEEIEAGRPIQQVIAARAKLTREILTNRSSESSFISGSNAHRRPLPLLRTARRPQAVQVWDVAVDRGPETNPDVFVSGQRTRLADLHLDLFQQIVLFTLDGWKPRFNAKTKTYSNDTSFDACMSQLRNLSLVNFELLAAVQQVKQAYLFGNLCWQDVCTAFRGLSVPREVLTTLFRAVEHTDLLARNEELMETPVKRLVAAHRLSLNLTNDLAQKNLFEVLPAIDASNIKQLFLLSIRNGDFPLFAELFSKFIQLVVSPNKADVAEMFLAAVESGNIEIFEALFGLEEGRYGLRSHRFRKIFSPTYYRWGGSRAKPLILEALSLAAEYHHTAIFKALLLFDEKLLTRTSCGYKQLTHTILQLALIRSAGEGDIEFLDWLLGKVAANYKTEYLDRPLMVAVMNRQIPMLRFIFDHHANKLQDETIGEQSKSLTNQALQLAIDKEYFEIVELMLTHRKLRRKISFYVVLQKAVRDNNLDLVLAMIDHCHRQLTGSAPQLIKTAVVKKHFQIAELILRHPNFKNKISGIYGDVADNIFKAVAASGNLRILVLFIEEFKRDISNASDALAAAASNGHFEIVQLIILELKEKVLSHREAQENASTEEIRSYISGAFGGGCSVM